MSGGTAQPPRLDGRAVVAARQAPPSSTRLRLGRVVAILALALGVRYLGARSSMIAGTGVFGFTFFVVECVAFAELALSAVLLARGARHPTRGPGAPSGTLDVFVTVCGESIEMVDRTLAAALAIDYPHCTYVLNDGRRAGMTGWESIDALAAGYGVRCFTRTTGSRGKAANLNYALRRTDGDFVATIDADHVASTDLAAQTLGYFGRTEVAFVCTSQLFQTSRGDVLNNREPLFYRFIQPAKDADSSAFSCGNGAVYRRSALQAIGGFSEWNLVEDLHTSYVLHAAGWKSVYHPVPVTVGSAPRTGSVFLRQRLRWATDSTRLLVWDSPLGKRGLSFMQRLHYLHTTSYYMLAGLQLLFLATPPLIVFFGVSVSNTDALGTYAGAGLPYLAALVAFLTVYGNSARAVGSALFAAPVYVLAAARAMVGMRPHTHPTEKSLQRWFSLVVVPQICAFGALTGTIVFATIHIRETSAFVICWAAAMAFLLAGPLIATNASLARERVLRVAVRGTLVLATVIVLGSHNWVWTRDSPPSAGRSTAIGAQFRNVATQVGFSWLLPARARAVGDGDLLALTLSPSVGLLPRGVSG